VKGGQPLPSFYRRKGGHPFPSFDSKGGHPLPPFDAKDGHSFPPFPDEMPDSDHVKAGVAAPKGGHCGPKRREPVPADPSVPFINKERSAPLRDASANVGVLKALIRSLIAEGRDWTYDGGFSDLTEEIKTRAARNGIAYSADAIAKAMRAAEAEWNRKAVAA